MLVVALSLAWHLRFIQDDAFISFTYARSLVEGDGLTWFGNYVEGYTNFLWVLWMALGMKLGVEPILWSFIGGMISFAVCVWTVWEIGRRLFDSFTCVLLAAILFIGNFSALSYATGGLETMLQTALLCLSFLLLLRMTSSDHISSATSAFLSLTMAAAVLTRLDSAVVVLIIGVIALKELFTRKSPASHYVALLLPAAIILVSLFVWRLSYYGRLLPNTYYAKVGWTGESLSNGLLYLWRFVHWYLI